MFNESGTRIEHIPSTGLSDYGDRALMEKQDLNRLKKVELCDVLDSGGITLIKSGKAPIFQTDSGEVLKLFPTRVMRLSDYGYLIDPSFCSFSIYTSISFRGPESHVISSMQNELLSRARASNAAAGNQTFQKILHSPTIINHEGNPVGIIIHKSNQTIKGAFPLSSIYCTDTRRTINRVQQYLESNDINFPQVKWKIPVSSLLIGQNEALEGFTRLQAIK